MNNHTALEVNHEHSRRTLWNNGLEQRPSTEHPGTTGKAIWRTLEIDNIRVRMVEYTSGYLADHWCKRGHVLLVLEGELETELSDGRKFLLKAGMS